MILFLKRGPIQVPKNHLTNLLPVSELFSRDKVVDIYVRNPNVVDIDSHFVNALSLAGIPRQELVLPLESEPEIRQIERCIFDQVTLNWRTQTTSQL